MVVADILVWVNSVQIAIRAYGSAKSVYVADPTTRAIDRIFDLVDNSVDAVDRVLNRGKQTEEQLQRHRPKRREVIEAEAAPAKPQATSSSSTAVAKKPRFHIVESVDPVSGGTLFVVTDGGNARAECTTRELAGQILRALEKP